MKIIKIPFINNFFLIIIIYHIIDDYKVNEYMLNDKIMIKKILKKIIGLKKDLMGCK